MNSNIKNTNTCYISAASSLNTNALMSLLRTKNIEPFDAYSIWSNNISSSAETKIGKTDFIIAILSAHLPNDNVLYEIGFARGIKKPVFLIKQEGLSTPIFLKNEVCVISSLENLDLVSLYLDKFLERNKRIKRKQFLKPKKRGFETDETTLIRRLNQIKENGSAVDFEHFVSELFRSQGYAVDLPSGKRDSGVDMTVWIDSLEASIGNPILVELKMGTLSESNLEKTERRLIDCLHKVSSPMALLIYFDLKGRNFESSKFGFSNIIRLDIYSLIKGLTEQGIGRLILEKRNRIAHGE